MAKLIRTGAADYGMPVVYWRAGNNRNYAGFADTAGVALPIIKGAILEPDVNRRAITALCIGIYYRAQKK